MLKNILSKLLGLVRKEKTEPVEPTTTQAQIRHAPPLATGLNPPNAAVSIPSPGGEGGFPLTNYKSSPAKQPPPPPIHSSNNPLIQLEAPARRLTGKVAKLPREIQRIINEMLDEAETYKAIVARLNDLGYPGFFEQNIKRWKDHGYQRWVQFQKNSKSPNAKPKRPRNSPKIRRTPLT